MSIHRLALPRLLGAALCALGLLAAPPARAAGPDEPTLAYTVAPHDTLIGLNRDLFAVPRAWPEVARLNGLKDPNRIVPGQVLKVPVRLLRSQVVAATVTSVEGDVRVAGQPARAGDGVAVGQAVATAVNSSAVVTLADGSRVRLAPGTEGRLDEHRRFQLRATQAATDDSLVAATLRLVHGSIEVFATQVLRAKPLEVSTPTAVIGVRGTEYRVNHEGNASTTEVLDGKVHVAVNAVTAADTLSADVAAGYGATLQAGAAPGLVALPPAPDLAGVVQRFERPLVRFKLPDGAPALRVQVAVDEAFDHILRDERFAAGSEIRIAGLDDGHWFLRARQVSASGIEGRDSRKTFDLKARPEPPAGVAPSPHAKLPVGAVALRWAENLEAASYRIEVARDAAFTQLAWKTEGVAGAQSEFVPPADGAAAGTWFWRLGSVRRDGDRGPWGDAQSFELRPLPEPPQGGLSGDGKTMELAWGGRAEDRFRVELARDLAFTDVVNKDELATPRWQLPRPDQAGTYYFRYRSVEPDGFVTPWSSTLKTEVPRDWRVAAWLLPLLLLLH